MHKLLAASILAGCLLPSCVSYQTYEKALADTERLQSRVDMQADSLTRSTAEAQRIRGQELSLEERFRLSNEELESLRRQYTQLDRSNEDLLRRYDRVLAQNQAELSSSSSELSKLQQELSAKELTLAQREADANAARATLNEREADLNQRIATLQTDLTSTQGAVAAKSDEVEQLRAALAAKDAAINSLRDRVKNALTGFSASDLSVEERNGQVYVSLSQNLLFASGSSTVNATGQDALRKVADALRSSGDIAITVEGHTDTDGSPASNWELSTSRALAVSTRLLAGGVDPKRITTAGRGQYVPIADNSTAEGKARNRRTEIILTPKLGELYDAILGS